MGEETNAQIAQNAAVSASKSAETATAAAEKAYKDALRCEALAQSAGRNRGRAEALRMKAASGALHGTFASLPGFPLTVFFRGGFDPSTFNSAYTLYFALGGETNNNYSGIIFITGIEGFGGFYMGNHSLMPPKDMTNAMLEHAVEGVNNFAFIVTEENEKYKGKAFINGYLAGETAEGGGVVKTDFINTQVYRVNMGNTGLKSKVDTVFSDFLVLNFDASELEAPYTVAQYCAGVPVPGELLNPAAEKRALLALANYTFRKGEGRIVPDYSGDNRDADVQGEVYGDRDAEIEKLAALTVSQLPTA